MKPKFKVQSVDHLAQIAKAKGRVFSDVEIFLSKPLPAYDLLKMSAHRLLEIIKKGLYCEEVIGDLQNDFDTDRSSTELSIPVLEQVQQHILKQGLLQKVIAKRVGDPQQRVAEFLNADSCHTRTLQKYIDEFWPNFPEK